MLDEKMFCKSLSIASLLLALASFFYRGPGVITAQQSTDSVAQVTLEARVAALESLLEKFSRSADGKTITLTGANFQVVNGSGSTDGTPNGLGNIIIGYNELRLSSANYRGGSHNLVVGPQHNYSSFGGIVVGFHNTISGTFASVSGGFLNEASGTFASVSGGQYNIASGDYASVSGGVRRSVTGQYDWRAGSLTQDK